ncbi:MAG TPA: hypothetical protein VGP38_05075 [Rubrobacter sp.]|nr:hypothetical protein [Rubrobacter sp.]
MKAEAASAHLHAIGANEEVRNIGEEQSAEQLEVPTIADHEVKVALLTLPWAA